MEKEKMFDHPAPATFIENMAYLCKDKMSFFRFKEFFNQEQSKDFYLGMIASTRVIGSIAKKMTPEELECICTEINIIAASIAHKKTNLCQHNKRQYIPELKKDLCLICGELI